MGGSKRRTADLTVGRTSNGRSRARKALAPAVLLVVGVVLVFIASASGRLAGSTFETGNGSLTSNTFHDWNPAGQPAGNVGPLQPISCGAAPASGTNCGTDLVNSQADNSFANGAKEDDEAPNVDTGSIPPNKDDLSRFYVNQERAGGNDYLYLAWERTNVLGSAHLDFELNQGNALSANGVTPVRTAGDLLITFDFGGSGSPNLSVDKWVTSGSGSQCVSNGMNPPCWGNHVDLSASGFAEGSVNTTNVIDNNPPGNPTTLQGGVSTGSTFGEAAINLTGAGLFPQTTCSNFGSVYLKSRSSGSSFSSALKDFIAPVPVNVSNCGKLVIKKVTDPSSDTTTQFPFKVDGPAQQNGLLPKTFNLTGGSSDTTLLLDGTTYSASEVTLPAGWDVTTASCDNGSGSLSGRTITGITVVKEQTTTCTFTNTQQAPALSITKVATESTYSKVGDVIHYTIVAKNTGNVTVSSATVTDPNAAGLVCTPPNGSSLAAGASMSCTATHTIVQADLDAGHYFNQACVDDGPGGAEQKCASVDTPASKLTITKVATESTYSKVGDVIHYTIVATNTGQTTLTNVTVTDPNAPNLICGPPNGSSLVPGASMNCSASHTIVQADLDAGHYFNQACVDDGPGGAEQKCASVDTPASKLTITKVATESGYSKVGDVIHYTIVATNTGQTTLASVTVTDPNAANLNCAPPNGSSLVPGASMNCTASHTIVQADLDAGHYFNQACVDDGPGGAEQKCASVDTPASKLTITKVATESTYSKVGDVIHYTIVATNTGQTTLTSVTVTDPNAAGLVCAPPNGSSLTAGASMNCTATHTIVQADLDAGHYFNQACVDDGPGGATQQCASVDTPASKLTITKVATESGYSKVGDVIHYTIVATNTGQTTLTNVTVTDPNAPNLICGPPNGSSLVPGASMNCSASHTIVQADLDAGHYFNQACVDDGPGGAEQKCASVDTPASKLTITKVATESGYSKVGDVIHYTIVATNTGQTTLASVTVTDPNAANLNCAPPNGSSLVPGASMNCTASHTIVQADLDAGHYFNQACVDDGPGGAEQKCASVDTNAVKVVTEQTIVLSDTAQPTGFGTPTGTVTFQLFTSSDCSTGKVYDSGPVQLANGRASSQQVTLKANGTYKWLVTYSGDANNKGSTSPCGAEQTTISGNTPNIAP